MKLTAKLLKKIIREAVRAGVSGIGGYYLDSKKRLNPDIGLTGAELSGALGRDVKSSDLQEMILHEIKAIINDFIEQYYESFIKEAGYTENSAKSVEPWINDIINKVYFSQPKVFLKQLINILQRYFIKKPNLLRSSKAHAQFEQMKKEIAQTDSFFASSNELYAALSPASQAFLKSFLSSGRIDRIISKMNEVVKANQELDIQDVSAYQEDIRSAANKEEVAEIFDAYRDHLENFKSFMGIYLNEKYLSMLYHPIELIIDPDEETGVSIKIGDPKSQKLKSGLEIVQEIESTIAPRFSYDIIAQHGDPLVQQKFMPENFPMTEAMLHKIIMQELGNIKNPQYQCPDIDPKLRVLLKSRNKETILQGLALVDAMWAMDVEFDAHGGKRWSSLGFKVNVDDWIDSHVYIEIKGRDAEKMFLCLGLDKLVGNAKMNEYRETGIYSCQFIPTGKLGNIFANHF